MNGKLLEVKRDGCNSHPLVFRKRSEHVSDSDLQ